MKLSIYDPDVFERFGAAVDVDAEHVVVDATPQDHFFPHGAWRNVACKRTLRRVLDTAVTLDLVFVEVDLAKSGTAYVTLTMDDRFDEVVIRIADHACYAGAFSLDGRTDNYTTPDLDFRKNAKLQEINDAIATKFGLV